MKLVHLSGLLALLVVALSARAELEPRAARPRLPGAAQVPNKALVANKAPNRYSKFCAKYQAACVAAAMDGKTSGNVDIKFSCKKSVNNVNYVFGCSANGVNLNSQALHNLGSGATITATKVVNGVPVTVTTQALATATEVVTSIATSVITSTETVPTATVTTTLLGNGEQTYPVTDYVIAPASGGNQVSRRDAAEFCSQYIASCKTSCHKVGTKSKVRTCKVKNELEGQYSLACICRNKRVRTQTALLAMAKDVKVVEVLSTSIATATATSTSTSTLQTESVVTTTLLATTTLSQGKATSTTIYALAPTGRLVAKDASTDARLGTVNGNGIVGIDNTDSQFMFVRDPDTGLFAFSDLAGNFLVGEQNVDQANFAPGSTDYAVLELGPSGQTKPQQPSGQGLAFQQGYETYIYNVHPLDAGGLEITPVWTQSSGTYAQNSWVTLLKDGTYYYVIATPDSAAFNNAYTYTDGTQNKGIRLFLEAPN